MHWKFEKILSVSVLHQKTITSPPTDLSSYQPEFSVIPAPETMQRFRRLGWLAKPFSGGIMVLAEKIVRRDGSTFFKGSPALNEALIFYIRLNQPAILNDTSPFSVLQTGQSKPKPNEALPSFTGQSRLIYLDNLGAVPADQPDGTQIIPLTTGEFAGLAELASRGITPFRLSNTRAGTNRVVATALGPGASVEIKSFDVKPGASSVVMDLPEKAWQIRQEPAGEPEILYLTKNPISGDVFGLIRIFNTEALPLTQFRRFQALFARAE